MLETLIKKIGKIQKAKEYLKINDQTYSRTLMVRVFPSQVEPGFFHFLSQIDFSNEEENPEILIRRTYAIRPAELKWDWRTKWKLRRLEASIREGQTQPEGPHPGEVKAYQSLLFLKDKSNNDGVVSDLFCYITIQAPTLNLLEEAAEKVVDKLDGCGMKAVSMKQEQTEAFMQSTILSTPSQSFEKVWKGRTCDDESISWIFPFTSGSLSDGSGVYFGDRVADGSDVYFDLANPDNEYALNMLVLGATGEGKSTFMKAIVLGLLLEGFRVFVFDIDGEWEALCREVGGLWIDHTMNSGRYQDPFRIYPKIDEIDDECKKANEARLSEVSSNVMRSISLLANSIDSDHLNAADRAVMKTWKDAGINPDDPKTWDQEEAKKASIHRWYQHLKSDSSPGAIELASKLWRYFEGTLRNMFATEDELDISNYFLVVFHVAKETDNETDQLTGMVKMSMSQNTVWNQVKMERVKGERFTAIVIDEGQRALRNKIMNRSVVTWSTTIRKFNGMLIVGLNQPAVLWAESGGEAADGGNSLWDSTPIKVYFYMEQSALEQVQKNGNIPEHIVSELSTMQKTKTFFVKYLERGYDKLRMHLPPDEAALYRTRGLKKEARTER